MSRWRNNGGWNKTHGTVEKTPRIDSFDLALTEIWGALWWGSLEIPIYQEEDRCVLMPECKGEQEITLSRKANGYGKSQTFFLCPICGARVRFLYFNGKCRLFKCRKCSQLNYRSQQETRSGTMFYYDKGMDFVKKHLDRWPCVRPDGFSFCDWIPDRPRYQHQSTYRRYLRRFLWYRQKHSDRQIEDLKRLLRICGKGVDL